MTRDEARSLISSLADEFARRRAKHAELAMGCANGQAVSHDFWVHGLRIAELRTVEKELRAFAAEVDPCP